jgi:arylsulfatase
MYGFNYDGSDPAVPFDEEQWELFHVADDPAETTDLAAEHPEKLRELIDLWWTEAERNQALPLNNQPGRFMDRRHRRQRFELHAGIGMLPNVLAPNVRNRGYRVTAELDLPEGGAEGVIASHGGHAGGYALYVQGGRLHFTYNFLGATITTVSAEEDLPSGQVEVGMSFTPTGRFQGEVVLHHGDAPVGKGAIARTTPITYGLNGFTVGYQRSTPVSPSYESPFAFPKGTLGKVVFETEGLEWRDPPAEERAGLAME